ncbi:hypothetical protein GDO86_015262 [Hymenochirus boettgeri]|uniref:Secreted protein n=1 Tax=Hymenochirus boettgeri TaxID=247094 RepID=A0A8T2JS86_9PIPI|nr:hypothetical protein GDO86_015262 [Hymenochirus boettgeri]
MGVMHVVMWEKCLTVCMGVMPIGVHGSSDCQCVWECLLVCVGIEPVSVCESSGCCAWKWCLLVSGCWYVLKSLCESAFLCVEVPLSVCVR